MEDIKEKLAHITSYISTKLAKNHNLVFKLDDLSFNMYEIDSIIREINYCLILDLWQASITLTNHLLEKYLKLLLIYTENGFKQLTDLKSINELYGEASNKYNNKDLAQTINIVCSKRLITKEEKRILHIFRDRFRNGFSHSDMEKIFKDTTIPLVMGNIYDPTKIEKGEAILSQVPFLQGIAQEKLAENHSLEYYRYVYELIKKTIKQIK